MDDKLTIRQCELKDAPIIVDLGARTFLEAFGADNVQENMEHYLAGAFTVGKIEDELRRPGSVFFLAEADGDAVGYAKLRRNRVPQCIHGEVPIELERIYTEQAYLGKGVGSALMRACIDKAESGGHDSVWLGVWQSNSRAIAFYQKWGFRIVGVQWFAVGDDDQPDHIMVREIG